MRSHTGGVVSLGKGAICASSKRQWNNTKSSTEVELVGINDALPQIFWTCYFLEAKGYPLVKPTKIYQYNMSTILLGKNGVASSGQRTRHINIRFFCHRSGNQKKSRDNLLPNRRYDSGFVDQTTAGQPIQEFQRYHSEHTM